MFLFALVWLIEFPRASVNLSSTQPAELRKVRVLPAGRDRSLIELTIHAPHVCAGAAGAATGPEPGSYVFLNVPSLALLEWHPFSGACQMIRSWLQ